MTGINIMDYDKECFAFGVECKEQGLDYVEFLAAFKTAYHHNQHAIDSAKAGYNDE